MENARAITDLLAKVNEDLQLDISKEELKTLAEFSQLDREDGKGEDRGAKVFLTSDGSVNATYQHPKNLLRIDFAGAKDIIKSSTEFGAAVGSAAALYSLSPWLLLLSAAYYFYKGTVLKLHPSDAKTLYAILTIERNRFSRQELNAAYEKANGEPLAETTAGRSITLLMDLGIIEHRGEQQYQLMTELTLRRQ